MDVVLGKCGGPLRTFKALNVTTVLLTRLQSCLTDFNGLNFRCAQLWSSV